MRLWCWWYLYFIPKTRLQYRYDKFACWLAFKLPKAVAKWAYVRVYAYAMDSPSEEYAIVATSWDLQQPYTRR